MRVDKSKSEVQGRLFAGGEDRAKGPLRGHEVKPLDIGLFAPPVVLQEPHQIDIEEVDR